MTQINCINISLTFYSNHVVHKLVSDHLHTFLQYDRFKPNWLKSDLCLRYPLCVSINRGDGFKPKRCMSWIHVYVYVQEFDSLNSVFSAACVLVENEVFIRKIAYTQENLPHRIPTDAETSHGFSFVLSWLSFVAYVIAGAIFLFTSHKRKADMADEFDECIEEDDPVVIRRWSNLFIKRNIRLTWWQESSCYDWSNDVKIHFQITIWEKSHDRPLSSC